MELRGYVFLFLISTLGNADDDIVHAPFDF